MNSRCVMPPSTGWPPVAVTGRRRPRATLPAPPRVSLLTRGVHMRKFVGLAAAGTALLGLGVGVGWAAGATGGRSPATPRTNANVVEAGTHTSPGFSGELVAFDSCSALLDALHSRASAVVGPYGFSESGQRLQRRSPVRARGEVGRLEPLTRIAAPFSRREARRRRGRSRLPDAHPLDHQHPGRGRRRARHRQDGWALPDQPRRPAAAHRRRAHRQVARDARPSAAGERTAARR